MNKNIIIGIAVLFVLVLIYGLLSSDPTYTEDRTAVTTDTTDVSPEVTSSEDGVVLADIMTVDTEGLTIVDDNALKAVLQDTQDSAASTEEQAGAIFMLEEEKLAHDVYSTLYDTWGVRIFDNISQSEKTHIAAVRSLAEAYSIPIGFYDETIGVFTDETLAGLYTELTERGNQSLDEAMRVGALIEELDIVDLQRYIDGTDNQDFITVYENLQKGSRNHLRAFARNIDGVYTPEYLEQAAYDSIIASGTERGRR